MSKQDIHEPGSSSRIEGVVERIVYENEENGFFVARLREEGKRDLTTFVGNLMALSPGDTVRLWGQWVDDKRFGPQLRVNRYETVLPSTVKGIEKYLGSGLIRGIGPTYAKRLVEAFGVETLRIIDEEPKRLRDVPGIGRKRAAQIREGWAAQRAVQSIMIFLQGQGISSTQAVKIYKRYGDSAVAVLRENPYRLAEDIVGIAFKKADAIAANLGIAKDSPQRAQAGLIYALQQACGEGHVFLPESDLSAKAVELLEVHPEVLPAPLVALAAQRRVVREECNVYLHPMYVAETDCAKRLKRLIATPRGNVSIVVGKAIQWVERIHAIRLSAEQRHVIRVAAEAKVMVVTGGPGTGKTTVINSLLSIFEKKGLAIALAAPTGRAAKRMEAATGREAKTIHRLLEYSPKDHAFTRDENNPLTADLIVIDESSMIDLQLMANLLKAIPPHTRLFLVGDVDQLPAVGPGNVLMDVIASNAAPVVWLKTVFRQAAKSGIISNAHRINRGEYPEFNADDFFLVERTDPGKALETVVELVANRMPRKFGLDPLRDIQVLAPMHRGDAGVERLNEELQRALNPEVEPLPRRPFGLGDKVMQLRNNYELDVYNGDVGVVTLVDHELKEVQVTFDDARVVVYPFDELDELTLAYASTVHKAQGSEYPAAVMTILPQHYMLLQRNMLYTAVTRGKRLVILVGAPKAVRMAVQNDSIARRNTRLADRLRGKL
ncbi:MAG TPA: ATP-dependent RecD-like DNA helicase [Candidatus Hydrogenedentes bacterium]|nr:ATP-dependent RecD-like DNA helicase [Candidatus Hydrogenedentota bacterium]